CSESRYGPSYPHSDIGLYVYGSDPSFGKENFVRILAPLTPLRIQELPDGIQSVLRNVEFLDLTFAQTESLSDRPDDVSSSWYRRRFWRYNESENLVQPMIYPQQSRAQRLDVFRRYREAFPFLMRLAESRSSDIVPPEDFPAAHSMDTTWFAVDADGHIGAFETEENGWVPASWMLKPAGVQKFLAAEVGKHSDNCTFPEDYLTDVLPTDLALLNPSRVVQNLRLQSSLTHIHERDLWLFEDLENPTARRKRRHPLPPDKLLEQELQAYLRNFRRYRIQEIDDLWIVTSADALTLRESIYSDSNFRVQFPRTLSLEDYLKLHLEGDCLGCFRFEEYKEFVFPLVGFYLFGGSLMPGNHYVREFVPLQPINVADLPRQFQDLFQLVVFDDIRFLETDILKDRTKNLSISPEVRFWGFDSHSNKICQVMDPPSQRGTSNRILYKEAFPILKDLAISRGFDIQPPDDYPAAHSGDVEWFAVDQDGHVGYFNPWSSAPVPEAFNAIALSEALSAYEGAAWELGGRFSLLLSDINVTPGVMYDLDGAFSVFSEYGGGRLLGENSVASGQRWESLPVQEIRLEFLSDVLLIVKRLEPVQHLIDSGVASLSPQRPDPPPFLVVIDRIATAEILRLLRTGECLACVNGLTEEDEEYGLPGVFRYSDCDPEDGIYGPYYRTTAPLKPITVDRFPDPVRMALQRVRFELSFLDSAFLQPWDHVPCRCSWTAYVDVDQKTVIGPPSARSPKDLPERQEWWNQELVNIEKRRQQRLEKLRSLGRANQQSLVNELEISANSWLATIERDVSEFRRDHPQQITPEIVRIELRFSTSERMLDTYDKLLEKVPWGSRPMVRGQSLILFVGDCPAERADDPSSLTFQNASWKWLHEQIESCQLESPEVTLGIPQKQPSGEEWQRLWEELSSIRNQQPQIASGQRPRAKWLRRNREKMSASESWDTVLAILMSAMANRFDNMGDYYLLVKSGQLPASHRHDIMAIDQLTVKLLEILIPAIEDVSLSGFHNLERILEFVPVADHYGTEYPILQHLRLKALSHLASERVIDEESVTSWLRTILEERDEFISNDALICSVIGLSDLPWENVPTYLRSLLIEMRRSPLNVVFTPSDWENTKSRLQSILDRRV
ncbi:MAG: hypothetical protein KDA80_12445, partial [Planctomycetaceae bacterium]|nr:hypothetical protein [Planctomycetaceae bacterium]